METHLSKRLLSFKDFLIAKLPWNLLSRKERFESELEYFMLIENIKNARRDWICANSNFNYAYDSETIDYYTYMIKACQVRYEYLIKKAKEKGVKICSVEMAEVLNYTSEFTN